MMNPRKNDISSNETQINNTNNGFSWDTFDLDEFFEEIKQVHEIVTRQDAEIAEKNKDGSGK